MTIYEIDQAKIGFVQAHAMLYELAFSVSDMLDMRERQINCLLLR